MKGEQAKPGRARFWQTFFWEFIQNLPLIAGFLGGLHLWQMGKPWPAVASFVAGSAIGAWTIWATESRIVAGHREPLRLVLVNTAAIAVLMLLIVVYLTAAWSRWWSDLLVGIVVGIGLGAVQSIVAGSPVNLGHGVAFALSFALALVGVRLLTAHLVLELNIFIITAVVTLFIVLLDYGVLFN